VDREETGVKNRIALIAGVAATLALLGTVAYVRFWQPEARNWVAPPPGAVPSSSPLPPVTRGVAPAATDDYERAIDATHQRGIRVWIETDLVKRWLAGKDSFDAAVVRVAALAHRPGVAGIKIADEIGYHDGLDSVDKLQRFLTESAAALRAAAPGRPLLVDMNVPELGCLPGNNGRAARSCAANQRAALPQLTMAAVDGYLGSGAIDVLNLSTYLQSDAAYVSWGADRDTAQRAAWHEAQRRGWGRQARLQARRALAHPGVYTGTGSDGLLKTFVEIPREYGAAAVDIWTWRQLLKNEIYRLPDPGLRPNELWRGLLRQRKAGAVLFTHLSPHSLEVGLGPDLDMIATVFTDLFVAAGTG
jgi:hypothetical protein